MKSNKLFLLVTVILFVNLNLFSQKDKEFWFAAPAITQDHSAENTCGCIASSKCGAAPVSLNFTNTNDVDANVTIEQPANEYDAATNPNGFNTINITVPANSFFRYELWGNDLCDANNQIMRKNVETRLDPSTPTNPVNTGIHITSTEYITAYYEVEEANNSDIYALKGSNALGDEFFVPFQTNKENVSFTQQAFSSINIVAVDAGVTTVTVYPTNDIIGWGSTPFTITLLQGESIALIPGVDNGGGNYTYNRQPADRLAGTRIVVSGNKRVAVTTGDDSVRGDTGCYDQIGDQLIPVEALYTDGTREALIGTEYVVMQGDLGTGNNDRLYIVATENNTDVTITDVVGGGSLTISNMSSQEQQTYVIPATDPTTYIESTKPIYVFHVTGAGGGCEIGGSILPSISACTGSYDVGFSRGDASSKDFLLNIMVREENNSDSARFAFTFNGVPRPDLGPGFNNIPGTKWWVGQFDFDSEVNQHTKNILSNSKGIFHLGTLNGGGSNGGNYGYFSDYSTVSGRSYVSGVGQPGIKMCYGETVQLVAEGGLSYEWLEWDDTTKQYKLGRFLSDNYAQKPYATPFSSIKYSVVVTGACNLSDTVGIELLVADSLSCEFKTDVSFGCAPLTVNINNTSYNSQKDDWYIDGTKVITTPQPGSFVFNNSSNIYRDDTIKLITRNSFCTKASEKIIRIFPEIQAGFYITDTVSCSPFHIQINDTAQGNIDTVSTSGYFYDFGDLNTSNEREPEHSFINNTTSSQSFNIQQVVTSPFLCRDTAYQEITVLPYIEAKFAASPSVSCSPLQIELDPKNSIGVDTFFWHVFDSQYLVDSMYTVTNENKIPFYHNDNTQAAPDSIYIGLITRNDEGCYDTVPDRLFVIYPEVHSVFTATPNPICDSTAVTFNNSSLGYSLEYYWDFDNGNSLSDTTGNNINHIFYNRGTIDSVYNVKLIAQTDYTCYDTSDVNIIVHPYVDARFAVEHQNNCSPLQTTIRNSSAFPPNTQFDWDMGDGNTFSYGTSVDLIHSFTNTHPSNDSVYTISLTVTAKSSGCSSSFEKDILVYPQVFPRFNLNVDKGCQPLLVDFTNLSTGGTLIYDWEFGDQSSSDTSVINFTKKFENASKNDTTYNITLKAINEHGCSNDFLDSVEVYAFIKANFDLANPDSCSPFPLDIDNTSKGGITKYSWNFDDGTLSNLPVPIHTYTNTSDVIIFRDLELVVENSHACYDTLIRQVTVYPEVTTDFVTSDLVYENCQPFLVDFVNGSNIPATNFKWDFGDGYDSQAKTPVTHTFENKTSNDVTYPVTLIATSDYGCSDTASHNIIAYAFIESNFTLADKDSCSPFLLDISNTSRGGIVEYNWDFDDGSAQTDSIVPIRTYKNTTDNVITRNLRLVVKNNHACYDTLIKEVKVFPEVVADFTTSDGIFENCQPFDVQLVNNSNIPATIFEWDYDDAGGSVLKTPDLHRFTNSGTVDSTYTVTLTATSDYGCRHVISKDIIAYAYIESNFSVENTDSCSPFPLRINNLSPGGVDEFFWSFGDGTAGSNLENPSHTYKNKTNSVLYPTLELIVKNQHACYDTMQQQITVFPEVVANFMTSNGLYEACQPFDVQFVNNTNAPGEYFIWTMDDGTYSIEDEPSKLFENNEATDQVYHVNLYAESDYQCIDDTTIDIIAYAYTEAAFYVDDDDVCYGYPIKISNASSPGSVQFNWNLGNGITRNDALPFTYTWLDDTEGRTYNLSLTARNSHGCPHTIMQPIQIFPQVRARIALSDSMNCHPLNAKFFNISENVDANDKFYWNFGNSSGTSSSFQPYDREFTNEGLSDKIYNIILRAEERDNGCFGYDTLPITVHAVPQTSFELVGGKTKGCPYFPVDIQNTTNPVQDYANSYHYIFGDKSFPVITTSKANVTHDYDNVTSVNQNYDLTLITTSAMGCKDTAFQTLTVHPRVTANFEPMSATESCSPYILEFEDRSVNEHVYQWSFGDGNISTDEFPSNRYVNDSDSIRTYKVLLKAISDYQCWDTASTVVTIYPQPTALFYATPHTQHYPSADVEVENRTNHAEIWNYDWDYDDNTSHVSNYAPDTHTYGYWGDYDIKMNVWSDYCADSMTRTITVYPALPIARFDSSVQGCVPLTVTFKDHSIYGTTHTWDFDDGDSYTSGPGNNHQAQLSNWEEEVTHTFTKDGFYNVMLTVDGDGGIDQTNTIIEVYPKPDVSFDIAPKTVMLPDEKIQTFNSTVANPDFQWLWNFGDGSHSTSKEPEHLYTELGKYDISLVVWTENMCVDSLVLEQIVSVEGTGLMEFPNAFVPSLSGPSGGSYSINSPVTNVFHPYHDGVVDYRLEIYTRWGELIFVSEDVNIGWDGYIKGSLAKQDVYVWRVKGTYTNGNPFIKAGDLTLIISPNQVE